MVFIQLDKVLKVRKYIMKKLNPEEIKELKKML